jgi:hypothetical protein
VWQEPQSCIQTKEYLEVVDLEHHGITIFLSFLDESDVAHVKELVEGW